MFVIADATKKNPSYFWKISDDGMNLIVLSLSVARKFETQSEANTVLKSLRKDDLFNFKVYELGIIA